MKFIIERGKNKQTDAQIEGKADKKKGQSTFLKKTWPGLPELSQGVRFLLSWQGVKMKQYLRNRIGEVWEKESLTQARGQQASRAWPCSALIYNLHSWCVTALRAICLFHWLPRLCLTSAVFPWVLPTTRTLSKSNLIYLKLSTPYMSTHATMSLIFIFFWLFWGEKEKSQWTLFVVPF